jgi:hypothetical protein
MKSTGFLETDPWGFLATNIRKQILDGGHQIAFERDLYFVLHKLATWAVTGNILTQHISKVLRDEPSPYEIPKG